MPANTLTVQECGAYKQQIEKEVRSLRPRNPAPYATLGPYAIPPPPPSFQESATQCADGSLKDRATTPRANSRSSSRSNSRTSSRATEQLSIRLQTLEQELSRERESRRAAEEKLDKLQATLEKIAAEKKPEVATQ